MTIVDRYLHGTISTYMNRRCRCDRCRRANAEYHAALKAAKQPPPPGDERHGTVATYNNYGCRCETCRGARREHDRRRRERAKS